MAKDVKPKDSRTIEPWIKGYKKAKEERKKRNDTKLFYYLEALFVVNDLIEHN